MKKLFLLLFCSLPNSFVLGGVSDTTPPQMLRLGILPAQVDVSSTSATVTITARITDPLAGPRAGSVLIVPNHRPLPLFTSTDLPD
jgi:hypothetical protein